MTIQEDSRPKMGRAVELTTHMATKVDSIVRFGGSTSTNMPWPEDDRLYGDDDAWQKLWNNDFVESRCIQKVKDGEGKLNSAHISGTM